MTIQIFPLTDDSVILNTARVTVWKDDAENLPSDKFMKDKIGRASCRERV